MYAFLCVAYCVLDSGRCTYTETPARYMLGSASVRGPFLTSAALVCRSHECGVPDIQQSHWDWVYATSFFILHVVLIYV